MILFFRVPRVCPMSLKCRWRIHLYRLVAGILLLPSIASGRSILLRTFPLVAPEAGTEFQVRMEAWSPGAAWEIPGREGCAVKISIDHKYDQHVFLFSPSIQRTSTFIVGPLSKGRHELRLEWDQSWSRDRSLMPRIAGIEIKRLDPGSTHLMRAPILHLRKDTIGRFSDVPLLMYWERDPEGSDRIAYTVIFSNEDGGTNTERLMARWGRTTDIEWCYSFENNTDRLKEEYQGPEHKTLPFLGRKNGKHPILYVKTLNNNFMDRSSGSSKPRVRLLPLPGDLRGLARERVMDGFPWIYALMAQEMIRENKVEVNADPFTARVSDLRNYAYLEVCLEQTGTEVFFELQLEGDPRWFSSHHADEKALIARSGCVRSTVELPSATPASALRALRIRCRAAPPVPGTSPVQDPQAKIISIQRLFLLTSALMPGPNLLDVAVIKTLLPGEEIELKIPRD